MSKIKITVESLEEERIGLDLEAEILLEILAEKGFLEIEGEKLDDKEGGEN